MISLQVIVTIVFSAVATYLVTLTYVRIVGLRSFSKMTSLDFAVTIAMGTMIATVVIPAKATLVEGFVSIAALFLIQWGHSVLRQHFKVYKKIFENKPVMIMRAGEILHKNLSSVHMTEEDLMAKLREANAIRLSDVRYAVLETTGDVSILHGSETIDKRVLAGVGGESERDSNDFN